MAARDAGSPAAAIILTRSCSGMNWSMWWPRWPVKASYLASISLWSIGLFATPSRRASFSAGVDRSVDGSLNPLCSSLAASALAFSARLSSLHFSSLAARWAKNSMARSGSFTAASLSNPTTEPDAPDPLSSTPGVTRGLPRSETNPDLDAAVMPPSCFVASW